MANGGKVVYQFIGDKTNLENTMKSVESTLGSVGSITASVVGLLTKTVVAGLSAIGSAGILYNEQMETYQMGLETLLGSSEQAIKTMEQIKEDARTTPFDVSGLTQANRLLISAGVNAEEARDTILALGDAVAASGGGDNELKRMAQNLQQIKNVGKASALDIKQFAYAGINIYQLLSDYFGMTVEDIREMKDITYEDISGALKKATKEGGKYYNAMNKQSKTLKGQLANLKDGFLSVAGILSEPVFDYLKDVILPGINDEMDYLNGLLDETSGSMLDKIVGAIPKVIDKIVKFLDENGSKIIDKAVDVVMSIVEAIIPKLPDIFNSLLELTIELVSRLSEEIPVLLPILVDAIIRLIEGIVTHLPEILEALGKVFLGIVGGLETIAGGDGEAFYKAFIGGIENGYTNDEDFWTRMSKYYEDHKSVFADIGTTLGDFLYEHFTSGFVDGITNFSWDHPLDSFIQGMRDMYQRKADRMIEIGKKIIKWIMEGILGVNWESTVSDMIVGLGNKIKAKAPNVYNLGANIGNSLLNGAKKVLGIHSPSTEFEWLAQMSVTGYEEGIENAKNELSRTLNGVFGLSPTMIGNASANLSPNIIVNNINNISMKQDPLGQMVNDIKNFSGGAKNDYNYGQV